tara:strand:- start:1430 stop:2314 length:885 start_codon:yes stop_codon:yes gene_type:complete
MLEVVNIRVRSFDLDYLDLFWEVAPTHEDVADYTFVVEKSLSEFGPFYDLTDPFANRFQLRDNTVRGQHSFYLNTYYRIRVNHVPSGTQTVFPKEGNGVCLSVKPDLVALEMARINRLKLKEFSGRKVWVFPKKKFGQRCSCYDVVTQRKTRSSCPTCFDTGWAGGYDAPMEIYAQVFTPQESTIKTDFAEVENENTMGVFPNYPELFEGWVVVEAENIRWRVGSTLNKVKKSRALVRQEVPLHRIPKGDIEYALPINISDVSVLKANPDRNMTNPQNLEAADVIDTALNLFRK